MNKEILGQFEPFITKMGKWRGKWANDDSDDYLGDYGSMVIIEGIEMRQPKNNQYESAVQTARKAVSNSTQDNEELIKQFETFISEMIAWRAKWVEDYPVDNDPLTDAIPEAHAAVVKANED